MPIKPELKALYPANWPAIRARVLARAGHRCEHCGRPNYAWRTYARRGRYYSRRVILTVAHLQHDPRLNGDADLACLCQVCHLRYDHAHHQLNAAKTRIHNRLVTGQLSLNTEVIAP